MKRATTVTAVCVFAFGLCLLNSCFPLETKRGVVVDRSNAEILVYRHGRHLGLVTAEGPFPAWNRWVRLYPKKSLPARGVVDLLIPADATCQYEAVQSGNVRLDFDHASADVLLTPAAGYKWLELDGRYQIADRENPGR